MLADLFALADALAIDRFALVGHDWGGAIAWAAAIRGNPRITRLAIVNSPHPAIFQKSLIDHPEQRAASQYMNAFRDPGMEAGIARMGLPTFFDKSFAKHVDLAAIPARGPPAYIDDWGQPGALTAMLNWYRASRIDRSAARRASGDARLGRRMSRRSGAGAGHLGARRQGACSRSSSKGSARSATTSRSSRLPGVGHFAPWQAPGQVAAALRPFLLSA